MKQTRITSDSNASLQEFVERNAASKHLCSAENAGLTRFFRNHVNDGNQLESMLHGVLMISHDAQVAAPYVNHIATMTGGVGFEDLSRFYKVCD